MSPKRVEKKGVVEGGALTPPPPPLPSQSRPQRNNTIPPPASAPSLPPSLRRCQGTEERAKKHLANGQYYYHFRVAAASRERDASRIRKSVFGTLDDKGGSETEIASRSKLSLPLSLRRNART